MHGDNDYKSNWLCISTIMLCFPLEFIMEQSICMTPLKVKIGLLNDIVQQLSYLLCLLLLLPSIVCPSIKSVNLHSMVRVCTHACVCVSVSPNALLLM